MVVKGKVDKGAKSDLSLVSLDEAMLITGKFFIFIFYHTFFSTTLYCVY